MSDIVYLICPKTCLNFDRSTFYRKHVTIMLIIVYYLLLLFFFFYVFSIVHIFLNFMTWNKCWSTRIIVYCHSPIMQHFSYSNSFVVMYKILQVAQSRYRYSGREIMSCVNLCLFGEIIKEMSQTHINHYNVLQLNLMCWPKLVIREEFGIAVCSQLRYSWWYNILKII